MCLQNCVRKCACSIYDQFKTRLASSIWITTFSGASWQGGLTELTPGIGYEVKVSKEITFCYGACLN